MFASTSVGEALDDDGLMSDAHHQNVAAEVQGIEHARKPTKMFWHAYHIDTVQDLVPEQIRWFYKESSKANWIPFIGYDSLRIECRHGALEYARKRSNSLSEDQVDSSIHVRGGLYEVDVNQGVVHPVYWKGESLPILRGTWFVDGSWQPLEYELSVQLEIDHLAKFMGQKIPDPNASKQPKERPKVLQNRKFRDVHVDWYSIDDVYMFSESASSKMLRYVTNKLSMQKSGMGTKLYRGYQDEARMDDKPSDVTHLVFVIHGIGQKWNENRIIHSCNDLRNGSSKLIPDYFPDLLTSRAKVEFLPVEWRTELSLDGDLVDSITPDKLRHLRVILNTTAMDILYYTSPLYRAEIIGGLENELNRLYSLFCKRHPYFEANDGKVSICAHSLGAVIIHDILTGWDPIELYDQYVSKKVSANSEAFRDGAAEKLTSAERSKQMHDFYTKSMVHKSKTSLLFKVTNLFALGSPLGVFLTLRGIRPQSDGRMEHLLPKALCSRLYNIYHPTDPVAYRLEPLVLKHYSTIAPLKIHKVAEPNKAPYTQMKAKAYAAFGGKKENKKTSKPLKLPRSQSPEAWTSDCEMSVASSHSLSSHESGVPLSADKGIQGSDAMHSANGDAGGSDLSRSRQLTGAVKGFFSRYAFRANENDKLAAELEEYESDEGSPDVRSLDGEQTHEQTELEYRLDYVLPGGRMANGYVGAVFAHTSYWSSLEVAMFLLSHMFPDYGPVK